MKKTTETSILLFASGFFATMLVLTTMQIYGQTIMDNLAEDQVIICVNGHIVQLSGNICKVFNVDDQSISQAQEDLYKNPESDTFNMVVID